MSHLRHFRSIWCFHASAGRPPAGHLQPRALVGRELRTDRSICLSGPCPHSVPVFDEHTLVVAHGAAELVELFRSIGWPEPKHLLDAFAEYRVATNGMYLGRGTEDPDPANTARAFHVPGEDLLSESELSRDDARAHSLRVVDMLAAIIDCIPAETLRDALQRGAYAIAAGAMQHRGIPLSRQLVAEAGSLHDALLAIVDREFGIVQDGQVTPSGVRRWARRVNLRWPPVKQESNALHGFFRSHGDHAQAARLAALHSKLQRLRVLRAVPIAADDRSRCGIRPFAATTGRNQPSRKAYAWEGHRELIAPHEGAALAAIDYSQQEMGIAAYLSGDEAMIADYETGDAFLAFGRRAGPFDASDPAEERRRIKRGLAAIMYGSGPPRIADRCDLSDREAREFVRTHKRCYRRYWEWRRQTVGSFAQRKPLRTAGGWLRIPPTEAPPNYAKLLRSAANFPVQASGAEVLWAACRLLHNAGVRLCGVLHDAVLIEAPRDAIQETVSLAAERMREAAREVLGAPLGVAETVAVYPMQFPKEQQFWKQARALAAVESPS